MLSAAQANNDLAHKIGQMLMVGFRGLAIHDDHPIVQDIHQRHLGGILLFDYDTLMQSPIRNIQSPEQVQSLTAALQEFAAIPLLIAMDQEGGKVNRLKERFGFPPTVSAQYLGNLNQLDLTRQYANTTAAILAELGITVNFAPVVDLNINPQNPIIGKFERSFSSNSEIVTAHALAWIQAHHAHHVLCALKHFPGHGSSAADSHLGWVDVTETWSPEELGPYAAIIQAGECDMVMTAHIFNARLDPHRPATLSRSVITGILREQLHYDGVIASDDLQMKAITSQFGFEAGIRAAIEAGIDLLILSNNLLYEPDITARAMMTIQNLVCDGHISRDRIEQSYQRIRRLKDRYGI